MGLFDDLQAARDQISRTLESVSKDLQAVHVQIGQKLESARRVTEDWLASDTGQGVLATLDYISLTSEAGDFFEHVGWYLPVHPDLHRYAIDHVRSNAPFDARDASRLVGPRSEHWAWISEGLLASEVVQSRLPAVQDAVFCLEHQRWHAAISTLLPVIEGMVSDRSGVLENMRVGRRLDEEILHKQSGPIDAICAANALAVVDKEIFNRRSFADADIGDDTLNRHLVLHGRTVGFGTEMNAVRTFMLLVALAELLDGSIVLRSEQSTVGIRSLLDEYGRLAPLRKSVMESKQARSLATSVSPQVSSGETSTTKAASIPGRT
jgi:hypothetical protein